VVASVDDAGELLTRLRPDAVVAAWVPGDSAPAMLLAELADASGTPVLLVGDAPSTAELNALLRAGVRGVLLPEASGDELAIALRAVIQGLVVLEPLVGRALAAATPLASALDAGPEESLTDREQEVLQLLALGLPNKTIATRLHISEHTVKFHVGSILAKLDAASRTEAVTRAARRGLLVL
jgi:DNA-binding NarL/FixJ family response regulator